MQDAAEGIDITPRVTHRARQGKLGRHECRPAAEAVDLFGGVERRPHGKAVGIVGERKLEQPHGIARTHPGPRPDGCGRLVTPLPNHGIERQAAVNLARGMNLRDRGGDPQGRRPRLGQREGAAARELVGQAHAGDLLTDDELVVAHLLEHPRATERGIGEPIGHGHPANQRRPGVWLGAGPGIEPHEPHDIAGGHVPRREQERSAGKLMPLEQAVIADHERAAVAIADAAGLPGREHTRLGEPGSDCTRVGDGGAGPRREGLAQRRHDGRLYEPGAGEQVPEFVG